MNADDTDRMGDRRNRRDRTKSPKSDNQKRQPRIYANERGSGKAKTSPLIAQMTLIGWEIGIEVKGKAGFRYGRRSTAGPKIGGMHLL